MAALVCAGCGTSADDFLMVASNPTQEQTPQQAQPAPEVDIWAVEPGEELADDARVAERVTAPAGVATLLPDGRYEYNQLATSWEGQVLMAYRTTDAVRATVGPPGSTPEVLAEAGADANLQTVVLRRGVAVIDGTECRLATSADSVEVIGRGSCQISEDERWVVSWPKDIGPLTIRDLRTDEERTVEDIRTVSAVALARDARVLAIEEVDGGVRGRLLSAEDGSTVARTDVYQRMVTAPASAGDTGFVAVARQGEESVLLWISTDGEVSEVDRGGLLQPVDIGDGVSYLRMDEAGTEDSVRHWSPNDERPEVLMSGRVGVGAAMPGTLVLTRATGEGVTFYSHDGGQAGPKELVTVRGDTSTGAQVTKVAVWKDTVLATVLVGDRTSLVRLDLRGDHSDVPVEGAPSLVLQSIDADGTVLLERSFNPQAVGVELLVLRPGEPSPEVRAEAYVTGVNLIHEGVVYFTNVSPEEQVDVRRVDAVGSDREAEVLYRDVQLAGSTWPELGGATRAVIASRDALQSAP